MAPLGYLTNDYQTAGDRCFLNYVKSPKKSNFECLLWVNLKEATKMAKVTVFRMLESTIVEYSPNFVQKRNHPLRPIAGHKQLSDETHMSHTDRRKTDRR